MGTKEARATKAEPVDVIFKHYSRGVATSRDAWAYNFSRIALTENMNRTIGIYNAEVDRWKRRENRGENVDDFVISDEEKIKWSRDLKLDLKRNKTAEYADGKLRTFALSSLHQNQPIL